MSKEDRTGWRVSFFAYAPIIVWIAVIFFLSSPSGSMSETSLIVGPILRWLMPNASPETLQTIHGYVRKTAHFTEYAILAFLTVRGLSIAGSAALQRLRYLVPILLVILIACLDEFNQSFEPSRTSSIYDVLLDISGGAAMIIFLYLVGYKRPATVH